MAGWVVLSSKPREIRWKNLNGRQMAFKGRRPQFLGGKGACYVLKQIPHFGHTVTATLDKTRHTRTYPKVYPGAKIPQMSSFSRGRNGGTHESKANTDVPKDMPTVPKSRTCHRMPGRTARKISRTESRSQCDISSTATLRMPRMRVTSKSHPDDSSSTPRRRIKASERGSRSPRHHHAQCTAASLSLRNKTQYPPSLFTRRH